MLRAGNMKEVLSTEFLRFIKLMSLELNREVTAGPGKRWEWPFAHSISVLYSLWQSSNRLFLFPEKRWCCFSFGTEEINAWIWEVKEVQLDSLARLSAVLVLSTATVPNKIHQGGRINCFLHVQRAIPAACFIGFPTEIPYAGWNLFIFSWQHCGPAEQASKPRSHANLLDLMKLETFFFFRTSGLWCLSLTFCFKKPFVMKRPKRVKLDWLKSYFSNFSNECSKTFRALLCLLVQHGTVFLLFQFLPVLAVKICLWQFQDKWLMSHGTYFILLCPVYHANKSTVCV